MFERLLRILWPSNGVAAAHVEEDVRQALCLLATRVAGRGATAAVRQRGSTKHVEDSPFYRLIFATEAFVRAADLRAPARRTRAMDRRR